MSQFKVPPSGWLLCPLLLAGSLSCWDYGLGAKRTISPAAPVVVMTAASDSGASPSDHYTALDPVLTWTAVEYANSYTLWLDGKVTDLGNVLTITLTGLAEGSHHFSLQGVSDGQLGASGDLIFTIDRTAPVVPAPASLGAVGTSSPTWTWPVIDDATSYLVALDGAPGVAVASASFTPAASLAPGSHAITVQAVDLAGNRSAASPAAEVITP